MPDHRRPPTDMRRFQRNTELRLVAAIIVFLTIIGNILVFVLFGQQVATASLGCSLVGAVLFAILYGFVTLLGWWSERR